MTIVFFLNPPFSKMTKNCLSLQAGLAFTLPIRDFSLLLCLEMVWFSFIFRSFAWSVNTGTSGMYLFYWNVHTEIWVPVCIAQNAINIFHMHTTWSHRLQNGITKRQVRKMLDSVYPISNYRFNFKETFWHISWHLNPFTISLLPLFTAL